MGTKGNATSSASTLSASLAGAECAQLGFKPPAGFVRLRLVKALSVEENSRLGDVGVVDEYALVSFPNTYEVCSLPYRRSSGSSVF